MPRPSDNQHFTTHYARLTALAGRVVADRATAEEVAADALAKLEGTAVAQRPPEEVAAWLNRVAVNGALNRVRGEQRQRARVLSHGLAAGPAPVEGPEEVTVRRDEQRRVRHVLAALPERQAVALLLRHAGHSYAEVAAALGVAEGSVGVLLARGERAFRTIWTSTGAIDHD